MTVKKAHRSRRKFDVKTEREAIMAISAGVTYFAIRKPVKTLLVILFLLFGPAYVAYDYFTTYRATIQEAVPIKPVSYNIENSNLLYAMWQNDNSIIINGQLYGYSDKRFECWVLKDSPVILVHDKSTGDVFKVGLRDLKKK